MQHNIQKYISTRNHHHVLDFLKLKGFNKSFNTHLSDPEPDPVLLPEEELSLLLSFSESDPDSLPDSDSNVFCNSIKLI